MANQFIAKRALDVSCYLKYIEHVLYIVSRSEGNITINDIRKEFQHKFNYDLPDLLNQNFIYLRLLPLIFIREDHNNCENPLSDEEREKVRLIRNSLAHGDIVLSDKGVVFHSKKSSEIMSYDEFNKFIHTVENTYYAPSK